MLMTSKVLKIQSLIILNFLKIFKNNLIKRHLKTYIHWNVLRIQMIGYVINSIIHIYFMKIISFCIIVNCILFCSNYNMVKLLMDVDCFLRYMNMIIQLRQLNKFTMVDFLT